MNSPEWKDILNEAREHREQNHYRQALQCCDRAALIDNEARYQAALLRGDILRELGDPAGALSSYESVADPSVPDAEIDGARGLALFDLARLAEADIALRSAIRGRPNDAELYYTLGLIAELVDSGQANEYFRTARKLAPERYPASSHRSFEEFEVLVKEAVAALPEEVQNGLRGVQTVVMDLPHPDDLLAVDPPISPRTFGMLVGLMHDVDPDDALADVPKEPAILLFKRNLERGCQSREALLEQLKKTLAAEASDVYESDDDFTPQLDGGT